jgi:hypothetical protein
MSEEATKGLREREKGWRRRKKMKEASMEGGGGRRRKLGAQTMSCLIDSRAGAGAGAEGRGE